MDLSAPRILVIEDDPDIAMMLTINLRDEGFNITHAADGLSGFQQWSTQAYDLLILDVMLPGIDGLEVCRRIRASATYTPIIMLSSKASATHRIVGLELGADDYLIKPFSMLELIARIRALLRRVEALAQPVSQNSNALNSEHLRIDLNSRQVWLDQQLLSLTSREFDLLCFFVRHPDQVFSRLALLQQVWGYAHDGYEHTVNSHINRLRAKIEADPTQPSQIVTVWGVGYKFCSHAEIQQPAP